MNLINSYYDLGNAFSKKANIDKIDNPKLIIFNHKLAKEIGLDLILESNNNDSKYLANIFSGNQLMPNSKPISLAYAGHQFGNFVPQLGDGRAALLGEVRNLKGELFDIQLKGSGRGFFSRNGDGKSGLNSTIREYIVSEAMYFLKMQTTRSLALIECDNLIYREEMLPASIVTRIAKSHIRVGSFEYFSCRNDIKNLKILADYTIDRHFAKYKNKDNKYLLLLRSVIKLQADLVSSWMSIGFIHGVMNSDNISISGQTIDYGPCAFMDEYDSDKVFSFIDKRGRYSFSNQRDIALWNMIKFAETLLILIDGNVKNAVKMAEEELHKFSDLFDKLYYNKMAKKMGIFNYKNAKEDKILIDDFLSILQRNQIDFTSGFRILSKILLDKSSFYKQDSQYINWHKKWLLRIESQKINLSQISSKMNKINPILIPRNHIIAHIIEKSVFQNDYSEFYKFIKAISNPFKEVEEYSKYYLPPKEDEKVKYTFCGT